MDRDVEGTSDALIGGEAGRDVGGIVIGVILVVPEPHASVLRGWRERVGDPQAGTIPPHVTLLPPTRVAAHELDPIETHLERAAVDVAPFPMHLSGTGTFRPVSDVVFVQVGAGIGECEVLQKSIRSGPLDRELDFPYHPHVTVAHDVDHAALDTAYDGMSDFVARFVVRSFALFERAADGTWTSRRQFPLSAQEGP